VTNDRGRGRPQPAGLRSAPRLRHSQPGSAQSPWRACSWTRQAQPAPASAPAFRPGHPIRARIRLYHCSPCRTGSRKRGTATTSRSYDYQGGTWSALYPWGARCTRPSTAQHWLPASGCIHKAPSGGPEYLPQAPLAASHFSRPSAMHAEACPTAKQPYSGLDFVLRHASASDSRTRLRRRERRRPSTPLQHPIIYMHQHASQLFIITPRPIAARTQPPQQPVSEPGNPTHPRCASCRRG
jgi:hypothetical protein